LKKCRQRRGQTLFLKKKNYNTRKKDGKGRESEKYISQERKKKGCLQKKGGRQKVQREEVSPTNLNQHCHQKGWLGDCGKRGEKVQTQSKKTKKGKESSKRNKGREWKGKEHHLPKKT